MCPHSNVLTTKTGQKFYCEDVTRAIVSGQATIQDFTSNGLNLTSFRYLPNEGVKKLIETPSVRLQIVDAIELNLSGEDEIFIKSLEEQIIKLNQQMTTAALATIRTRKVVEKQRQVVGV